MGQVALLPLRRHAVDFFTWKIRWLWLGSNPWSWVPGASMLTTRPPEPLVCYSNLSPYSWFFSCLFVLGILIFKGLTARLYKLFGVKRVSILKALFICYNISLSVWCLRYRHNSVSTETLDSPEIKSRWGEVFHSCADGSWGPPNLLYNGYHVSFPGVKWPGCGVDHPRPSSAEVKERVELNLYSTSGCSWPVRGMFDVLSYNFGNCF
jgi:hypothetical protein